MGAIWEKLPQLVFENVTELLILQNTFLAKLSFIGSKQFQRASYSQLTVADNMLITEKLIYSVNYG